MEVIEDVSNIRDLEEFGDAFFEYDPYDYDECELEHDIQRLILSARDLGYVVVYEPEDEHLYTIRRLGNPPEDDPDDPDPSINDYDWYYEISSYEYQRVLENMKKF